MGNKRNRLKKFLTAHPICCYCGGGTSASTEDHWPSRSIFKERKWPQGYVFPACIPCQQTTSDDETLFALLCRLHPKDETQEEIEHTRKLMAAISERLPDIYHSFFPSANKVKSWLRESKQKIMPGQTTKDIPMLSLEHPGINERVRNCAAKLFLSLHYLHTKKILPSKGGIFFMWYSNANMPNVEFSDVLSPFTSNLPNLKWQHVDLSDQFLYRYGHDHHGETSIFHVVFHASIGMIGVAFSDLSEITIETPLQLVKPFTHN